MERFPCDFLIGAATAAHQVEGNNIHSDAWAEDPGFSGWVSIDVTHNRLMTDAYCRLAVGRDYESAAPVRGETYFRAEIAAGRVGPEQAAPRREFD